ATRRGLADIASRGARRAPLLVHEIRLVGHSRALARADAHEDALVEPLETKSGGLDSGRRPERVFVGVDIFTAGDTGEHIGRSVPDAARTDGEQLTAIRLQRVADVAECSAVRPQDLPVGAGARQQLSAHFRTLERSAGERHDAAVALGRLA